MSDVEKGLRVRSFFEIEARTLLERYLVIETLLPNGTTSGASHRGEEGRYIESLLRSFLNKHLPGNLRAVSGFIICPSTKTGVDNKTRVTEHRDRHSGQIDIIVYDFDSYPVYERFEEFCIVPPEGVIAIISVKKRLYKSDIEKEMEALKRAANLCEEESRRGPFTAIFAFSNMDPGGKKLSKPNEIMDAAKNVYSPGDRFDVLINEISVLGEFCLFKVRPDHSSNNKARYVMVNCREEVHIPVQRILQSILSVYYDETRGSTKERPGFVSFRKNTFKDASDAGFIDCINNS